MEIETQGASTGKTGRPTGSTEAGERPATSSRVEVVEKTRGPVRGKLIRPVRHRDHEGGNDCSGLGQPKRIRLIVTRISEEVD